MIIAEIGVGMSGFPTWARFVPGVKESAGEKKAIVAP